MCRTRKLRAVAESPRFEVHFLPNEVYHANRVLRMADVRQTGMFDAPLPDEFDRKKDIPEEIEVDVANCTGDSFKYDLVTEPPPGHTDGPPSLSFQLGGHPGRLAPSIDQAAAYAEHLGPCPRTEKGRRC